MAAVRDVDFEVGAGEILGISGPNGAGKTTLFDVISGLTRADSGSIRFMGEEMINKRPWEICQHGIGRTFQLNACFETLTVEENVIVGAYYGHFGRIIPRLRIDPDTSRRVDQALTLVGLSEQRSLIARDLPVLGRKLLMIAGAIATGPKILLMDEPVGGLNPEEIKHLSAIINRLCKTGLTLIIIEHVMRFLVSLSTRMMILHHGEKIFVGTPSELVINPRVVEVYLGQGTSARLQRRLQPEHFDDQFAQH